MSMLSSDFSMRQLEGAPRWARPAAVMALAFALSGCVRLADQISKEAETKRAACQQQSFRTNVEKAQCLNTAEARLGEVWGADLAVVHRQSRLVIAERQDRKELTDAEAELELAKVNVELTSQAARRRQERQLAEAQYEAAAAQRRIASAARSQASTSGSFECVSKTVASDLRTECRDNGVNYIRGNPATHYQ